MQNNFEPDDFETEIQPEDLQDDNPIDSDFEPFDNGPEFDEGSDRDNWEEQQVFLDGYED